MKNLLMIIGAIIGALLIGVVLIVGYGFMIGPSLDKESAALDNEAKTWIDETVPRIVSSWSTEELLGNSSSEFVAAISKEDIDRMMTQFEADLGFLEHYNGAIGKVAVSVRNFKKSITATYKAQADFEKGSADVLINAIREGDQWKIYNFHVDAKNLSSFQ